MKSEAISKMNKKIIIIGFLLSFFCNSYSSEIHEVEMIGDMFKPVTTEETVTEHQKELKQEAPEHQQQVEQHETESQEIEKVLPPLTEMPKEIHSPKVEAKAPIKQEKKMEEIEKTKIPKSIEDKYIAALVADKEGNIYYNKNIDKPLPMASVTKIMTLLVTFDAIRKGEASYQDKVTITKDVYRKGGSGISMKLGETFTLIDLIRATAIYSANNAAYTLAKHIGKGSIPNFIKKMNQKAREIGVSKEISYHSPAGLPTRYTKLPMDTGTARGIYKLSLYALKYPEYMEIAGIKQMKIHNGKINIRNRNHLIGENGVYGIKTGYHKEAKYNITVASKEGKSELIVVVLGGDSYQERDKAVLYLLEKVRSNFKK